MPLEVLGQRCLSEREPELGLGIVASVDRAARRLGIDFPATGEKRLYALGTSVLKRVQFRAGDSVTSREGTTFTVETVEEEDGLLVYFGAGRRLREDGISDVTSVSSPAERLMAGQVDPGEVFELRSQVLEAQAQFRQSEVRGFLGGRIELIPHQFYILHEVAARQIPRVLLADEVGLGKTIEACLIVQRLLAVGQARRVLILVPESLTHQWFVELLRRFNLWFSIYDEERCTAQEQSTPGENPFLSSQLALAGVRFLAADERRREQAIAAGWDVVVVDEAHHLAWAPDAASPEYAIVEALARRAPGLLLLTATPTQLGLAGHFARLRLLDPDRYNDFDRFVAEAEGYATVAGVAEKILAQKPLTPRDHAALKAIFQKDPVRLEQHLAALAEAQPGAREALLKTLLDQHGTGRVMFRNTRAAMSGFPKRKFCPVPLGVDLGAAAAGEPASAAPTDESDEDLLLELGEEPGAIVSGAALLARAARELQAEESGTEGEIRYAFRGDPRIKWLVDFLRRHRTTKVLLICRSPRKVAAIEAAVQERAAIKSALFHEGLSLVQRDRNAAWFAEPDGAQLLLCSEIGSEGRNFQFAHHLVLFDLPLNPGLLEQRIGRLDRIGQTETIRIHVPYLTGSATECVIEWYQRGLNAFEAPLHGGDAYRQEFRARLLALAAKYRGGEIDRAELDRLVADTSAFREVLARKLKQGRDRLLELASFNRATAESVIERVRAADADPRVRQVLLAVLEHFGVEVKEHEAGDLALDPSRAYLESFPSVPAEGMLATFSRSRATAREDLRFLSADHPLMQDALDLLIDSPAGTAAFGTIVSDQPNLLLEAVFVLETVADSRWRVDQFLAPTPVRVLIDLRGTDLTAERDARAVAREFEDADIHRFLERPGFDAPLLQRMLAAANGVAAARTGELKSEALARATAALDAEAQRLEDLRRLNDQVRPEEIELTRQQLQHTRTAIEQARLRLDSIRLIVQGPA
ncbi:RNA polymerase-associated protein RapA [Opitutus terrae]|uniref:Helicase domain protein n=1 Tax=Opitutus terrae (strain DSM 11246 / JCM 15787 / PB90-1) TaxID=452637 RepID=B1ZQP7_OPITP|nr:RNA polymerase-associated protein RapA [Opitutus terrae]ACB77798.1 helicase domain protein [Opitutus terrae PB90-1]